MVLAVVRSHYGNKPGHLNDREKIYRAGNALADWLGLNSWVDIVAMQGSENRDEFARMLREAK